MLRAGIGWVVVLFGAVACAPGAADAPTDTKPVGSAPADAAPAAPASPGPAGFTRTLALQGITFRVSCTNRGSINELRIEPAGLLIDNSPMVQEVEGTVTGAEVADLDADGSPEIYVYVQSAGSGSYGSLVAYSANNLKSLSGIYLAPVSDDPQLSKGYMGHDRFAIDDNQLVRLFPIYTDADTNAKPTGGTRELHYRLAAAEAGWVLRIERVVER